MYVLLEVISWNVEGIVCRKRKRVRIIGNVASF